MDSYQRMRSIGVSVETADALAPTIDALPPRKREAFFMWSSGYRHRDIAISCNISCKTTIEMIETIRSKMENKRLSNRGI